MKYLTSKEWWGAVLVRAVRSFAFTAMSTIGTAVVLDDVNWLYVLSASGLSVVITVLGSLAGLPEVKEDEE